ncbi:flavin-dependent oxidoreductase FOX5-like [Prunus yedoensis var. nudiflora]|uniref:Flavin-dependent oxidoreductase FOX5-like n=1 Tax=Prunus yedoensis var. nudiflora TaxID=2094558 RepID=A0A314Z374_PRUYE|nr:flavin-dependent oxidoreductase FOX5-like [Prunus yedoensis var. nudiflora]
MLKRIKLGTYSAINKTIWVKEQRKSPKSIILFNVTKTILFNVTKTIEKGSTDVTYKWQTVAPELPEDLFLRAMPQVKNINTKGNMTLAVSFIGQFLGQSEEVVALLNERFPELGLQQTDCHEVR